jgi:phytanoyl-CoA hydroxylase
VSATPAPKQAPALTQREVATFDRDGYLSGPRVLDDQQVEELRDEMERVLRAEGQGPQPVMLRNLGDDDSSPVWQVVDIWRASPAFERLVFHPWITTAIGRLTRATSLRIWHDQVQYKPAAVGGVNMWHQDAPLWPVLRPMTEVSAWVALDDVDEANGCMSMVPGSHRWGDRMAYLETLESFDDLPATFEGHDLTEVRRPVRAGEVHFHHALTWHGSRPNQSGRPRRAVALHFMTERTRFVAGGEHVMKQFIDVEDGRPVAGEYFPVVWEQGSEP